jgi:O-succinylbenzoic acid--CoA ligase
LEPSVKRARERFKEPWLSGPDGPVDLAAHLERAGEVLDCAREEGIGGGVLVCAEAPAVFLAGWWTALERGLPVFLGDPNWSPGQWEQLEAFEGPTHVFSDRALPYLPAETPQTIGFGGLVMVPTGGTGGKVRFAMHRWETLLASVRATQAFTGREVLNGFCTLGLHHVSGLMQAVRALCTGGSLRMAPWRSLEQGPLPQVDEAGSYCLSLVPTQLGRLLERDGGARWLRRFGTIFLGGGPASEALLEAARREKLPLHPVYGMTETASMVAGQRADAFNAGGPLRLEPLAHARFRQAEGLLEVAADSLFLGYYPQMPRQAEWFRTGDRGLVDADGALHLQGRADRVIITGGEKAEPALIEAALLEAGLARECLVFGQSDPDWGERVTALIVPVQGRRAPALAAVRKALRPRLPAAHLPRAVFHVERIPRNAAGKPDWAAIARLTEPS